VLLKAHGRDLVARIDGPLESLDSLVLAGACKAKPPLWAHGMHVVDVFSRGLHCISLCLLRAQHIPSTCCYQYAISGAYLGTL
jgi:hypothetical protein